LILIIKAIVFVINWLSEKFKQLIHWVKTSDSGFAKFIRGSLRFVAKIFQAIGDVIDWVGEQFNKLGKWVATSDSGFAKFIRGTLKPLIKLFEYIGELIDDIFGSGDDKLTLEEQGIDRSKLTREQLGLSANVPEAEVEKIRTQQIEKTTTNNSKVDININDPGGISDIAADLAPGINLSKTVGI
jgi:hypothetical protein